MREYCEGIELILFIPRRNINKRVFLNLPPALSEILILLHGDQYILPTLLGFPEDWNS